jgi:hypothetical protein
MEYKFPKGKKMEYKSTNEIKQVTTMMGQESVNTINSSENLYIIGIAPVDDNNFKVEFYLDNITFSMTSDIPQANIGEIDCSFMANKKSSALISKKGEVSSIETIDELELPDDPVTKAIAQQYSSIISISKFFLVLPEKDLKVGETWKDSKTNTTGGDGVEMNINTEFSYTVSEKVNYNGYSCLKVAASITQLTRGQGVQMGQEFKVSGKGEGKAIFYFAQKEGMLIGFEVEQTNNLNMDFTSMEMTIPMTTVTSSKVELVK